MSCVISYLRGISVGMGVDFDVTKVWAPMAEGYLKREAGKESGGQEEEGRGGGGGFQAESDDLGGREGETERDGK